MTGRATPALLLVGLAGFVSFGGRSRTFDSTRLTTDPGWIVAARSMQGFSANPSVLPIQLERT